MRMETTNGGDWDERRDSVAGYRVILWRDKRKVVGAEYQRYGGYGVQGGKRGTVATREGNG